jgi:nucleotide-binding universal stress UspA family protein
VQQEEALAWIAKSGIDMVIVGAQGRKGDRDNKGSDSTVLGSFAKTLVSNSPCNVLVVRSR